MYLVRARRMKWRRWSTLGARTRRIGSRCRSRREAVRWTRGIAPLHTMFGQLDWNKLKELEHASDDVAGARGQIDQAGLRRALLFVGSSLGHQGQGQPRLLFALVHGEFPAAVPDLHFERVMLENSKRTIAAGTSSSHCDTIAQNQCRQRKQRIALLLQLIHYRMQEFIDSVRVRTLNVKNRHGEMNWHFAE